MRFKAITLPDILIFPILGVNLKKLAGLTLSSRFARQPCYKCRVQRMFRLEHISGTHRILNTTSTLDHSLCMNCHFRFPFVLCIVLSYSFIILLLSATSSPIRYYFSEYSHTPPTRRAAGGPPRLWGIGLTNMEGKSYVWFWIFNYWTKHCSRGIISYFITYFATN
jgi:hypothetical protein